MNAGECCMVESEGRMEQGFGDETEVVNVEEDC